MIDGREWIALFSHTGSEIANITNKLGFGPDRVITNKMGVVHRDLNHCTRTRPKPDDQDYQLLFADKEPIITLHGWMRIIPGSVCEEYDIYNLHPGLITQYPELKGKDPQERVFTALNIPQYVGCVIHRATDELDSGEIIMSRRVLNTYPSVKLLTHALHDMAGDMWVDFFEKKLYNNE